MTPALAKSTARTPAWEGIAQCSRFTDPPVCVYSWIPAEKLADTANASSMVLSSSLSSVPAAAAEPNGPTATGGWCPRAIRCGETADDTRSITS